MSQVLIIEREKWTDILTVDRSPPSLLPSPGVKASSLKNHQVPSQPPIPQDRSHTNTVHNGRIEKTWRTPKANTLDHAVFITHETLTQGPATPATAQVQKKVFPFLELPGEIRNKIYEYTTFSAHQALLIHLPRRATLRCRPATKNPKRISQRPFYGLTQVCRQVRVEFRPIYLMAQEIGLDFTEANKYLSTFYGSAPPDSAVGNITVAVSGKISKIEMGDKGVDVWPMLDVWANSLRIEAGFGRYSCKAYDAVHDGEAKDLYRLFGRYVLPDRKCSRMNSAWRTALRGRYLAELRIHRKPKAPIRPFFHIIYRPAFAEPWMDSEDSTAKMPSDWYRKHGFERMEHFQVKVGTYAVASTPDQVEAGLTEEAGSESSTDNHEFD